MTSRSSTTTPSVPGERRAGVLVGRHEPEAELALLQRDRRPRRTVSPSAVQSPDLHGPDHLLDVAAEAGPGHGRHDLQHGRGVRGHVGRSSTSLTFTSSAMRSTNGVERGRRRASRRSATPAAAGPGGPRACGPTGRPSTRRARGPSPRPGRGRRELVGRRPVGEVHLTLAGEPAVDLLGDQRQQRRRHPAQRSPAPCTACRRPPGRRPRTGRGCGGCTSS